MAGSEERESVQVLRECIELQNLKGADYQAAVSDVRQADYYRLGIDSIYDMMHTKMLRLRSLMEKSKTGAEINFESLEDTAKDLINYSSFFTAYLRGGVDGQVPGRDMFNRPYDTSNGGKGPAPSERITDENSLVNKSAELLNDPVKQDRAFAEGLLEKISKIDVTSAGVSQSVKDAVRYIETGLTPNGKLGLLGANYPRETIYVDGSDVLTEADREYYRTKAMFKAPMNRIIDPIPGVTQSLKTSVQPVDTEETSTFDGTWSDRFK